MDSGTRMTAVLHCTYHQQKRQMCQTDSTVELKYGGIFYINFQFSNNLITLKSQLILLFNITTVTSLICSVQNWSFIIETSIKTSHEEATNKLITNRINAFIYNSAKRFKGRKERKKLSTEHVKWKYGEKAKKHLCFI